MVGESYQIRNLEAVFREIIGASFRAHQEKTDRRPYFGRQLPSDQGLFLLDSWSKEFRLSGGECIRSRIKHMKFCGSHHPSQPPKVHSG